jgi:hypothetical protein
LKGVFGQLIFGGYDASRIQAGGIQFTLAGDISRDIVVGIQAITYHGKTDISLLDEPVFAFIDSTDPNLWLPQPVVAKFEDAFGLTYDNASRLYLINDTHHESLIASKASVSFRLADSLTTGQTVSITFSYEAFGLAAKYPFVQNDTRYFPLKTATNEKQITLGRVFLQEA